MRTILVTGVRDPADVAIISGLLVNDFVICYHDQINFDLFTPLGDNKFFTLILGSPHNKCMFVSLLEIYQPDYYYHFASKVDARSISLQLMAKKLVKNIRCFQINGENT